MAEDAGHHGELFALFEPDGRAGVAQDMKALARQASRFLAPRGIDG